MSYIYKVDDACAEWKVSALFSMQYNNKKEKCKQSLAYIRMCFLEYKKIIFFGNERRPRRVFFLQF